MITIMKRNMALTLGLGLLVGCGTSKVWYQTGKSLDETQRELAVCRAEAARLENPLAMANAWFALANDANKKDYIKNCMIAKGYSLIEKNAVPGPLGVALERPHSTFDEREFAPYAGVGTSSIVGQALLKTRGGDVKVGAGNEVVLCPVTPYSTEYYEKAIVGEQKLQPPDERIVRFFRSTIADANGQFEFRKLPAGEYFLGCKITWEIAGVGGTMETTGGVAYGRVRVEPEDVAKVVLTR
jgi:hypothetical protein